MYIMFDGPCGIGKGTVINNITKDWKWGEVDRYFDPGISNKPEYKKWQELRSFIKNEKMDPLTETFMFFALRAELMSNITKSLSEGRHVIQDRGHISTWVYQGYCKEKIRFIEEFENMHLFRPKPNLVLILFAPFEVLTERLIKRNANIDKFKSNDDFRRKVWEGYKWYINVKKDKNQYVIDASGTEEEVKYKCLEIIEKHVSGLGK